MIFDTDVLIWAERGNKKALNILEQQEDRHISLLTYMELLQGARSKDHHQIIRDYLKEFDFNILPITQAIGHRASIYIEEYSLSTGLRAADALIAATAQENNMMLITSNAKHFKAIKDINLKIFKAS